MEINDIPCGKYRHYRTGNLYEVIGIACHSETNEEMVIYKSLYPCDGSGNNQIWARPKKMFMEHIVYNGYIVPRFNRVNE
jgi:hypothetical protein